MFINYNRLKKIIIITKENSEKFREQTKIERTNLKEALLYHKCVISPLQLRKRIDGYELVDGHHRWQILPSVIKECPEFNLDIPVIFIPLKDVNKAMLQTQLGRRNLNSEDISQYVDTLQQKGLNKEPAIKQTAEDFNISVNQVKNAVYPGRAKQDRERKSLRNSAEKHLQTTETSLNKEAAKNYSSNPYKEISKEDEDGFVYEELANGSSYKVSQDGSKEYINRVEPTPEEKKKQMFANFKRDFTRFRNKYDDFTVGEFDVFCKPINEMIDLIKSFDVEED